MPKKKNPNSVGLEKIEKIGNKRFWVCFVDGSGNAICTGKSPKGYSTKRKGMNTCENCISKMPHQTEQVAGRGFSNQFFPKPQYFLD